MIVLVFIGGVAIAANPVSFQVGEHSAARQTHIEATVRGNMIATFVNKIKTEL